MWKAELSVQAAPFAAYTSTVVQPHKQAARQLLCNRLLCSTVSSQQQQAALGGCSVGRRLMLPTLLPSAHLLPPPLPPPLGLFLHFALNLCIKATSLSPKGLEGGFLPLLLDSGLVRGSVTRPAQGHCCFQYREDLPVFDLHCPLNLHDPVRKGGVFVIYTSLG